VARPRTVPGPASRDRLIAAATAEFAAQGLAAANVDRIARAAGLTKAMLYYHFAGKEALYREVLRSTFEAVGARLAVVRDTAASPDAKLVAFVEAFVSEASARPHFPRMLMRELTESGRHLDRITARAWIRVPDAFFHILHEGIEAGVFRPIHPLFALLTAIGPTVLAIASEPARQRLARLLGGGLPELDLAHLTTAAPAAALSVISASPPSSPRSGVTHDPRAVPARARRKHAGRGRARSGRLP
jgi:TetR/AcrR family transcriptional regulator